MSTLGVRRVKERAGGKVTAALPDSKPVTPFSDKARVIPSTSTSISGREKPRSVSRGAAASQNPAIRPIPRIGKPSAAGSTGGDVEARRRLSSTSSVPRGRSSSSSEFTRILSDSRRTRVSSVAVDQGKRAPVFPNRSSDLEMSSVRVRNVKGMSGFRVSESKGSKESGLRASDKRVLKENMKTGANLGKELVKLSSEFIAAEEESDLKSSLNDINLSTARSSEIADICALDDHNYQHQGEEDLSSRCSDVVKSHGNPPCVQKNRANLSSKVCGKDVNDLKVTGVSKYPSKLHEKLAFLEGKVKRIASDIKRTKEMLDTNNTSASKVIISDIQEKISGIEKAMSHVVGESDRSSGISRNMDTDSVQNIKADGEKILVKGQNSDELEARIFSHQKLLNVQSDQCQIVLPNCETWTAEKTVSYPINENPILFEYLASVNQPKFSMDFCNDLDVSEIEETKDGSGTPVQQDSNVLVEKHSAELQLTSDEHLEEFDEQENTPVMIVEGDNDENSTCQIRELGRKASTGGWFVSEGESVLLVHDDGSCSLHDAANSEVKSEYKPPSSIFSNIWSDCWIIRAPSSEGCSGKYVVAASAGNTLESGFCSWDYHTKEVQAFHIEEGTSNKRSILAPLQGRTVQRRNTLSTMMSTENRQWWYKPLGSLIVSTASFQKSVQIFDIRDGEGIMKWNVQKPVLNMDHSSPLQWRNSRKIVIAEADAITLWDVGSLTPQALLSIPASGHKISALHVNNTDAEGGGVRRRTSSSEAEGHDGVFCTVDSINILDFREPSGIGLKIPTLGVTAQSVFSRGDSVFLGCSSVRPPGKTNCSSQVQHFSLRRQKLVSTYVLPESNAHFHHTSLNQVWGNSDLVMGVSGQGLFVFDALRDEILPSFALDYCGPQKAREVIGSDDLYSPTFDYSSSQVLLISRDRPATFKYL